MEPGGPLVRYGNVENCRSILSALGIVAVMFGVPVIATLIAGQFGLSYRLIGWGTLAAMMVLTYQCRFLLGRLCLGQQRMAPAVARRSLRKR